MPTFITPIGYSGSAELTAANGLQIVSLGHWRYSQAGYNDGATFGVSLTYPEPLSSEQLRISATNWPIATIGNQLISYTDPDSGITYSADRCRIEIIGRWNVLRQVNSNSYNSFGVEHTGLTETDQGSESMTPYLLSFTAEWSKYVIQGSDVAGGTVDTFSSREFWCQLTESAASDNSNKLFQSNTIARPVWQYQYSMSWQID